MILLFVSFVFSQQKTAKEYFDSAALELRAGNYKEALKLFEESARLNPENDLAHASVGFVSLVLENYRDAVSGYEKAIELDPDNARYHAELCRALRLDDRPTEAISACRKSVSLDESIATTQIYLLQSYSDSMLSSQDLAGRIEAALVRFPDYIPLLVFAAVFYEDYDVARASEILLKLTKLEPQSIGWKLSLASIYLKLRRDAEAISLLRESIQLQPKNARAHMILGRVFAELGLHPEAIEAFGKAISADPDLTDAYYLRGISANILGRFDAAIEDLREAASRLPDDFDIKFELGEVLNSAARYEEAALELRKASKMRPDDIHVKISLGLALFEAAEYEEGIAVLSVADQMQPGDPTINMFLRVARARQQSAGDLEKMKKVAKDLPKDINIRLIIIQTLTYARKSEEAKPYIEEFWAMNPSDTKLLMQAAATFMTSGDYLNAEKAYKRSLEIAETAGGYFGLAMVYQKRGDLEGVIESYKKAFAIQENAPGFLKIYGDILGDNARHDEALEAYRKSLSYQPNFAPALEMAGFTCVKLGRLDEAQVYLERLRQISEDRADRLERYIRWKSASK